MRVTLAPAFILHTRHYRENSLLLDVFSKDYGRISLIGRGLRAKVSTRGLLQPFIPLLLSWSGKTELMHLTHLESRGLPYLLRADKLLSAFYLNELLVRVIERQEALPTVFDIYQDTLQGLASALLSTEKLLRLFEKNLLKELGYALPLHQIKEPNVYYTYCYENGFNKVEATQTSSAIFFGEHLISFANDYLENAVVLMEAKRLMRLALMPLLGSQPLFSRKLYVRETL